VFHWVTIILLVDGDNCQQAYYLDPLQSVVPRVPVYLQQQLQAVYHDSQLQGMLGHQQSDKKSCGPLALENCCLASHVMNKPKKKVTPQRFREDAIGKLRRTHIVLSLSVEKALPLSQTFYCRQALNRPVISSLPVQLQCHQDLGKRFSANEAALLTELRLILQAFSSESLVGNHLKSALQWPKDIPQSDNAAYLNHLRSMLVAIMYFINSQDKPNEEALMGQLVHLLFGITVEEARKQADDATKFFKRLDFRLGIEVLKASSIPVEQNLSKESTKSALKLFYEQQKKYYEKHSNSPLVAREQPWKTVNLLVDWYNQSEGASREAFREVLKDIIELFPNKSKDWQFVQQILALAGCMNETDMEDSIYQLLFEKFLETPKLHNIPTMVGLAWLIHHAPPHCYNEAALTAVLNAYLKKLKDNPTANETQLIAIFQVIGRVLDALHHIGEVQFLKKGD